IYLSCLVGAAGASLIAIAPTVVLAEVGVMLVAVASGAFLSREWALLPRMLPKASSGRYMGISNVATACAGPFALLTAGTLMDIVGGPEESGSGPRAAVAVSALMFAGAALLLTRVVPQRREEDEPALTPVVINEV